VTVQASEELIVYVALSWQVPDGFGPYEMPPLSVKVTGNAGVKLALKSIWPLTSILGAPFTIRLDTEQLLGVMVN
jgi:hypothetical protein